MWALEFQDWLFLRIFLLLAYVLDNVADCVNDMTELN